MLARAKNITCENLCSMLKMPSKSAQSLCHLSQILHNTSKTVKGLESETTKETKKTTTMDVDENASSEYHHRYRPVPCSVAEEELSAFETNVNNVNCQG